MADTVIDVHSDVFPIPPSQLAKLVDPKSPEFLKELGGIEGIAKSVHSNLKDGLPTSSGANDTLEQKRVEKYGRNVLPPAPRDTFLEIVWGALQDQILLLLIAAAVISIILGSIPATSEDPKKGWFDGVAILFAVVIVVGVTSANDFQKQRQFAKLDAKKNDRVTKVLRGGEQTQINILEIAVGDIVLLDTGDVVCADGLFMDGYGLKTDESSVTGESDMVKKVSAFEHEGDCFMISGSQVVEGMGRMFVTAVGPNSFNGRLLLALRVSNEDTPLQEKLEVLAGHIGKFGIAAAVLLLLIGIPKYFIEAKINHEIGTQQFKHDVGQVIVKLVISAITIVVVAVPEGLPLAVTIALAYGMLKLFKENNLVRHLAACETMGGATNICSDKTGTLTQNEMTVVTAWFLGKKYPQIAEGLAKELPPDYLQVMVDSMAINSTAFEVTNVKGKIDYVGSKTEGALIKLCKVLGVDYEPIRKQYSPYFKLYPFSSARKAMSTVIKTEAGYRLYSKGASEIILSRCDKIMMFTGSRVEVVPLDDHLRNEISATITEFATDALRTLCMAYSDITEEKNWDNPPEDHLTLISLVGIRDPLRPEVPGAVATCQRAGITVRMVTGDNIVTAQNIAKACGILRPGGVCLEGPVFRDMPEAERKAVLPRLHVLARSSPTDKQLLVGMLKDAGEVVAVTGDGTNDGPALKMADIGFSMGISGTEVAIAASDVVLLDDNFASIVKAALWGRNIFDAIRKFIQFQLTVNVVAVVVALVGTLSGSHAESPLTAVQLLWVNLIMDSLAALALATEEPTPNLLERRPTGRSANLITRKMWRFIAVHSVYQLAVCFVLLYAGPAIFKHRFAKMSPEHLTIIFNTFVFMQLFNEINARKLEDEKNMFDGFLKNKFFVFILIGTIVVQIIFVEFGGDFTNTHKLVYWEWFICVILGLIELPIGLLVRFIPIENRDYGPAPDPIPIEAAPEYKPVETQHDVAHAQREPLFTAGPGASASAANGPAVYQITPPAKQPNQRNSRAVKRRWSLVRTAVKQIGVLSAFKAMKTYRTVHGIEV
eukprot:Phypoly_transcript_01292.p1 GENE.Phypoly_transcript_01292~~Phypoly_transcript_01292.p1  ORF type:complete len:1073 (+),score=214.03 Phypoly_transcript_01292:60-3221(+)